MMAKRFCISYRWRTRCAFLVTGLSTVGVVLAQSPELMRLWQDRTRERLEALDPGATLAMACIRLSDADSILNEAFRAYSTLSMEGYFGALDRTETTLREAIDLLSKAADAGGPGPSESVLALPFFQVDGAMPVTREDVLAWMVAAVERMIKVLVEIGDTGEEDERFGQVFQTSAELRQVCSALIGLRTDALRGAPGTPSP